MVTVMIVDDDIFMHKVFERILSLAGHMVIEHAFDGQEAVEKYVCSPDLILMDHRMPVKNGVDATREMLTITPETKILFVSADESAQRDAFAAGAVGFLAKPIRSKKLLGAIDKALGLVSTTILGADL
jgi:two-component system chemotaxis response regulator CheY